MMSGWTCAGRDCKATIGKVSGLQRHIGKGSGLQNWQIGKGSGSGLQRHIGKGTLVKSRDCKGTLVKSQDCKSLRLYQCAPPLRWFPPSSISDTLFGLLPAIDKFQNCEYEIQSAATGSETHFFKFFSWPRFSATLHQAYRVLDLILLSSRSYT